MARTDQDFYRSGPPSRQSTAHFNTSTTPIVSFDLTESEKRFFDRTGWVVFITANNMIKAARYLTDLSPDCQQVSLQDLRQLLGYEPLENEFISTNSTDDIYLALYCDGELFNPESVSENPEVAVTRMAIHQDCLD